MVKVLIMIAVNKTKRNRAVTVVIHIFPYTNIESNAIHEQFFGGRTRSIDKGLIDATSVYNPITNYTDKCHHQIVF